MTRMVTAMGRLLAVVFAAFPVASAAWADATFG